MLELLWSQQRKVGEKATIPFLSVTAGMDMLDTLDKLIASLKQKETRTGFSEVILVGAFLNGLLRGSCSAGNHVLTLFCVILTSAVISPTIPFDLLPRYRRTVLTNSSVLGGLVRESFAPVNRLKGRFTHPSRRLIMRIVMLSHAGFALRARAMAYPSILGRMIASKTSLGTEALA